MARSRLPAVIPGIESADRAGQPLAADPPVIPFDHSRLRVFPLAERRSLTRVEDILIPVDAAPPALPPPVSAQLDRAVADIRAARARGAAVMP